MNGQQNIKLPNSHNKLFLVIFFFFVSCISTEDPRSSLKAPSIQAPESINSLEKITSNLPPVFAPEVTSSVKIINRSNLNLRDVHLNILDSNNNYFYSGNAMGFKNLIQKSGLSMGGNKFIRIQKIYKNKTSEIKKEVSTNKPLEIII